MKKTSPFNSLSLIHEKWKVGIVSNLPRGPVQLSQLRRMFPQASNKMLDICVKWKETGSLSGWT